MTSSYFLGLPGSALALAASGVLALGASSSRPAAVAARSRARASVAVSLRGMVGHRGSVKRGCGTRPWAWRPGRDDQLRPVLGTGGGTSVGSSPAPAGRGDEPAFPTALKGYGM